MTNAGAVTVLRQLLKDTQESRESMPATATFSNLRAIYLREIEALSQAIKALKEPSK